MGIQNTKFKKSTRGMEKAGPVAKNISDEVWNEFRSHFDVFFEKRNSFLNTEKKKWKANADAKQAIVTRQRICRKCGREWQSTTH